MNKKNTAKVKKVMKGLQKASRSHLKQSKLLKSALKGKRIKKPFARKIQILTVGEQRAKVMGKSQVVNIFKKGKESIRNAKRTQKS